MFGVGKMIAEPRRGRNRPVHGASFRNQAASIAGVDASAGRSELIPRKLHLHFIVNSTVLRGLLVA